MINFTKKFFSKNLGLKITALILALTVWFFIVGELNKGTEEERQLLKKILPSEDILARKLLIRPVFIGKPRSGYFVDNNKVITLPEYCIVVGARDLLGKVRFAYTMPIDLNGVSKTFTKSVSLSPIAPGVFLEETLVQVTVPIENEGQ